MEALHEWFTADEVLSECIIDLDKAMLRTQHLRPIVMAKVSRTGQIWSCQSLSVIWVQVLAVCDSLRVYKWLSGLYN